MKGKLYIFSIKLTASNGDVKHTAMITAGREPKDAFKKLTKRLDEEFATFDHAITLEEIR
jgi:hypothetical protein